MSELQVNKISPRSGTGVTLGDSGDTFTIPAGVTLAGAIPAANLTGALPAISGANLTGIATGGKYKFMTGTWDLASTGNFSITGVGFTPKYIIGTALLAGKGTGNISMGDDDLTEFNMYDQNEFATGQWGAVINTKFFTIDVVGLNIAYLIVASYDADGITFTKQKVNAPTGTGHYGITFFG